MGTPTPLLLVIDNDRSASCGVEEFARARGFDVISRSGAAGTLDDLASLKPDAAFVDLQAPDIGGLHVLRLIRQVHPTCEVVLMTGEASVDSAIEAVKLGALDYIGKPLDFERMSGLLETVRHGIDRRERLLAADSALASKFEFYGMIGRSPVMQELFDTIRRLAPHVRTALITGETGTGKELVARALHRLGARRDRRFVAFNCSAIADSLFESEFFGHNRGAFTGATEPRPGLFEHADGGTLFLDEIGELPVSMQPKLLRAVEYGEIKRVGASESRRVDLRVVAATNRELSAEVAAGRFRQDLFYRLNIIEFRLPPLREHREDISYLTASFVKEFSRQFGKSIVGVSPGAERLLHNAPWPGNVRQLRNVIERSCMATDARILTERDVLAALGGGRAIVDESTAIRTSTVHQMPPPRPASVDVTREQIEHVLQQVGGNRSAAARFLGISRRALYRRLDSLGLRAS